MNSARTSRGRGFSLIEALISVTIVLIAIVGVMGAFSQMTRTQDRALRTEKMHRLACEKLDELIATGDYQTSNLNGTFEDRNESDFSWQAELNPTDESNLDSLTVTVTKDKGPEAPSTKVIGIVYVPSTTTTQGSGTATGAQTR